MRALRAAGFPEGFVCFVEELYGASELHVLQADRIEHFSAVTAGVLQVSPLSSALFVAAVDFLVAASVTIVPRAEDFVRGCADNTAGVLGDIRLDGDLAHCAAVEWIVWACALARWSGALRSRSGASDAGASSAQLRRSKQLRGRIGLRPRAQRCVHLDMTWE